MLKTKKDIFDRVYKALEAQGWKQSLAKNGEDCMYFGEDEESRCAAGHLLDPQAFQDAEAACGKRLEFQNIDKLALIVHAQDPSIFDRLFAFDARDHDLLLFVRQLQLCHDQEYEPLLMKGRFDHFAKRNGLEIPE